MLRCFQAVKHDYIARPPRSSSKAFFASARDAAVPKCAKHCASFVLAVWDVGSFRQLPRTRTLSSQRFKGQKRVTKESPEASRIGLALPALRKSGKELLETLPESPQNPIRAIPRGFWKGKSDSQGAKEIARSCRDSTFNAEFLTASGGCFASHSNHFKGLTKTESVTVRPLVLYSWTRKAKTTWNMWTRNISKMLCRKLMHE